MTPRHIGAQVKKIRKSKGIKQNDLALKIGLSTAQVKYIEDGRKKIDDDLLGKLEETLGEKLSIDTHTIAA